MSSVASLFNVPNGYDGFNSWAFAHAAHHRDIIRVIYDRVGFVLDEYVLEPLNPDDMGAWLYHHQVMHKQMDSVLGISGYNLLDVNFKDQQQLAGWIWLNSQEHYQAANTLQLG